MDQQTLNNIATAAANAAAAANFQLFQAIQQAPKALVMEEPRGPSQIIEIQVLSNGLGKIPFPYTENLTRNGSQTIVTKAMRLITPSVLPTGPISGLANAPLTELQKMSVVLYCEGWEKGEIIPILTFNDMFTEGSGEPFRRGKMRLNNWKNIEWTKCFILYSNTTSSVGASYAIIFDVEYIKLDAAGNEIVGPA